MILPFSSWHVDMMSLPPEKAQEVDRYMSALERLGNAGWVRTIVEYRGDHVEVLGVAGVAPQEDGEGEVFVVMAEQASRKEFVRGVRQLLELARRHFATIRALGDDGDIRIERWLSWLGFRKMERKESATVRGKHMAVWRLA